MKGIKAIETTLHGYWRTRTIAQTVIEQIGLGVSVSEVAHEYGKTQDSVRLICAAYLQGREDGKRER